MSDFCKTKAIKNGIMVVGTDGQALFYENCEAILEPSQYAIVSQKEDKGKVVARFPVVNTARVEEVKDGYMFSKVEEEE